MPKIAILLFITCFFLSGCKSERKVTPAFYYWKTVYKQDSASAKYTDALGVKSLYLRVMDVDLNPDNGLPIPVSPVRFDHQLPSNLQIVPVVFIVNAVFKQIGTVGINRLADQVAHYVDEKIKQGSAAGYNELQIDCDWTKTTKENYFAFINRLQQHELLKDKTISVTLRMHQVKNQLSNGIPPVKKAMLMCYNMGNLRKYGNTNSILNRGDLEAYLKENLHAYPLRLDVALPLFKWAVVFRQKEYAGISKRISLRQLSDSTLFEHDKNGGLYLLKQNLPEAGLRKGDEIRWEEISPALLLETSGFLSRYLAGGALNIAFYHLDAPLLKDHPYEDLEKIINQF